MRLAAIDIGSNAARLLISDVISGPHNITDFIKTVLVRVPLRLGFDVFDKGDLGVGLIYAALGTGFVLSSMIAKWIRGKYITVGVLMILLEGVGHLLLSQSFFFVQALVLALAITFVGGISDICFDTVLMRILPSSKRVGKTARAFSLATTPKTLPIPGGKTLHSLTLPVARSKALR